MSTEATTSPTAPKPSAVSPVEQRAAGGGGKVTRLFSGPLMKQTVKSNLALVIVILLIMLLMSNVINFAMSIMGSDSESQLTAEEQTEAQQDFYTYLYAMASFDEMAQADLSWDDFESASDTAAYEQVFDMLNAQADLDLSVEGLEDAAARLALSDVSLDTYVRQFEYVYALGQVQGIFSGDDLDVEDMLTTMFEVMGVSSDLMDTMESMDSTSLLNQMYFTVMGLLPILLLIVIVANDLIASKVDRGSMAYVLSTPTKRTAVVFTQAVYLVLCPLIVIALVCCMRIGSTFVLFGEANVVRIIVLYVGMYILTEACCGICYMGSCLFNRSMTSLAFGGGITVWFFLASLMGMFGSPSMVDMGIGVESLGIFNNLTLIGLFDISSISTIGTDAVTYAFLWKFAVLAAVAVVCYVVGAVRFQRKDLPL